MSEREYDYVSATFSAEDVKHFQELTSTLCREEDLYHSNSVNYIQGNVSKDLHMTIFYGLLGEHVDKGEIQSYIDQIGPITLSVGSVSLRIEHKKLCQILWVDVLDTKGELSKIAEGFKSFPYGESEQLGFVPHLTLAYVKKGFVLGENYLANYPKEIKVRKINYCKE